MKKFKFRYESILTLRLNAEDDVKNELAAKIAKRQKLMDERDTMQQRRYDYDQHIQAMVKAGCRAETLQAIRDGKDYYRRHINRLDASIETMDQEIEATQERLVEAVKARKIMEKVKENEYAQFMDEFNRDEQKVIEEIVNYKNNKTVRD
ncbi:flagellar export protein FliJ [Fusibacter paucivorans]|uniref:Flagellar FliJ protein n=1 Tax=Fusibacter paucivorans TaxID=76009 RepID=A0ABS5PV94_9FIRM|nr:flagellar export protein FliJ [Fusibacter paucivorans]MBS7528396.1 flagellar export protein FliJ [Fusibacter paucivorans]